MDKLSAKDIQDIALAEHAEVYIQQVQHEQQRNPDSLSHKEYDVNKSRQDAFG